MRPGPIAAALLSCAIAHPVAAAEDEWVASAEPGWALFDGTAHGGGSSLSVWFGATDTAWLFASGGAYAFSNDETDRLFEGVGGLVFALDVLRTIPFLEAGVGVDVVAGRVTPLVRIGIGADYLVTPELSVGAAVRYRPLFGSGDRRLVSADLRLSWRGEL